MARHIVISFDDNDDAEQFIEALKVDGAVFFQDSSQHFKNVDPMTCTVIGVYAKPTQFCQCTYADDMPTARSKNYGWYVHTVCKKPIPGHYQSALKNLIEAPNTSARTRKMHLGVREGETRWPEPKPNGDTK